MRVDRHVFGRSADPPSAGRSPSERPNCWSSTFDRFADQALQRARDTLRGSPTVWRPELVRDMVRAYDDLAEALPWCNRHDTDPQRAWQLCASLWAVLHQGRADDV